MAEQSARFLTAADAEPGALDGTAVAVIGYGNLGRAMARNLRDSGQHVVVGNIDDEYRVRAAQEGFTTRDIPAAAAAADLVYLLLPDEVLGNCFAEAVTPALRPGSAIAFGSGYALAFDQVRPGGDLDVLLLAPRMLGPEVRRSYERGEGFVSYVNVEQDATGRAWKRLIGLADAAGSLRRGALVLSAADEATLDLFIEQSVGPYLGTALQVAFRVGVEAGLPPEALVLELYLSGELARTLTGFAEQGFYQSVTAHGLVATYGGFLGTLALDQPAMERRFREVLEEIRGGGFAARLQQERADGYPTVAAIGAVTDLDNPMTAAERAVRAALGRP